MAIISADLFQLGIVKLNASNQVPANPAFLRARLSGESINFQPQTSASSELDPLAQVRDSILTGARSGGSVDMPLTMHTFFDEVLAAVMRSSWSANVLNVGSTLPLYCVEKRFPNPAGGYIYHRFNNSAVQSVSISITPGNEITASANFSGGSADFVETIITGATYPDPGTEPIFTAPEVTEVTVAGVTNALCFNNLGIELNSNVRGIECIGTLGYKEQVAGRFEASIRGSCYFVSNDLLDYLLSQATFASTIELKDSQNNKYKFEFPRCKMTNGGANAGGTGQDVLSNITIQPLYDTVTSTTVKITRTIGT